MNFHGFKFSEAEITSELYDFVKKKILGSGVKIPNHTTKNKYNF